VIRLADLDYTMMRRIQRWLDLHEDHAMMSPGETGDGQWKVFTVHGELPFAWTSPYAMIDFLEPADDALIERIQAWSKAHPDDEMRADGDRWTIRHGKSFLCFGDPYVMMSALERMDADGRDVPGEMAP
jgi:hypothetical protein